MIKKEGKFIVIRVTPIFDYDISIDQIKADGLDNWLQHLRVKNWWNEDLEEEFISTVNEF